MVCQQQERWRKFLLDIKNNFSRPPWRVFLSFAPEPDEDIQSELEIWLKRVESTLKAAGATDVFLDLSHMGNKTLLEAKRVHLSLSNAVIIACTPRYYERSQAATSGIAKELNAILEEASKREQLQVLPLIVKGKSSESVPAQLQDFKIRDSSRRSFEDLMSELAPLGIIPDILGCGHTEESDVFYKPLLLCFQLTNLPPVNPGFVGRGAVLETLYAQLVATHNVAVTQRRTLSGLGGIGKTQTALAFAHKFESEYVFCRWLISDTTQAIEAELEQLARKLKVKVDDEDMSAWMASLFEKLHGIDKWLLVFDNVESSEMIAPYLPKLLKPGQHIIMTSRSQQFSSILNLDVLEQAEVDELLRVHLKGSTVEHFTPQDASQLGERLGRLPLALSQATAYMRIHGVNIRTYLKLLDEIPEDLLSKHGGDDMVNYPRSLRSTFLLSIEKIELESLDAITVLNYCAWMHADDIPLIWVEQKGILGSAAKAANALEVLRRYSMTSNGTDGTMTIKIHRLVQDVVLFSQSKETKMKILECQRKVVNAFCPQILTTQEEILMARSLVPHLQRMIEVSEKFFPANENVLVIMSCLQNIYQKFGDNKRRTDLLERALKINEIYYGPNHFEVAATLRDLGNSYGSLGQPAQQQKLLERALKIQKERFGPNHREVAVTLTNLGCALLAQGMPGKELLEQALNIQECHHEPDDPVNLAITLTNLGTALGEHAHAEAKKVLERALKIKEKRYGEGHFEFAKTLGNLANTYGSLGQHDKEKELLERVLKIFEEHYGSSHVEVAKVLSNLGSAHWSLHENEKAKELLERALKINEEHYGPSHFEVAAIFVNLGMTYDALGQPHEAKKVLESALKIQEKHFGIRNFKITYVLFNLAMAHDSLGEFKLKKELLERSLAIEEHHWGLNHRELEPTLTHLAQAYRSLGYLVKHSELIRRIQSIKNSS